MPQIVLTTDEIGVREGRDILFLSFRNGSSSKFLTDESWVEIPERQTIIQWLEDNHIDWEMCLHASPGTLITSYKGVIYLDLAPDSECEQYQLLLEFLEDEQENCRFPGVNFWLMPLSLSEKVCDQRKTMFDE